MADLIKDGQTINSSPVQLSKKLAQGYTGRYQKHHMSYGCLYLNNNGSRWVNQDMRFVLVLPDGTRILRLADHYESFGNFAVIAYRYKGKRLSGCPKAHDGSELRDPLAIGLDALQHIFLTHSTSQESK